LHRTRANPLYELPHSLPDFGQILGKECSKPAKLEVDSGFDHPSHPDDNLHVKELLTMAVTEQDLEAFGR
jgi:hypothetical protein